MSTVLHVGCGFSTIQNLPSLFHDGNWEEIRLDIAEDVNPDIIGTLQDMSLIEDESVDAIYSSHNIEHVWAFEVPQVIREFYRVLKPSGFAITLCPDIISVAQAITQGYLNKPVYESPAGPITAMDILYGFHSDLIKGRHYMAHKTAFTADSLAEAFITNGFAGIRVVRDAMYGLHSVAVKQTAAADFLKSVSPFLFPPAEHTLEVVDGGCFS